MLCADPHIIAWRQGPVSEVSPEEVALSAWHICWANYVMAKLPAGVQRT